jgi:hypothetical protein
LLNAPLIGGASREKVGRQRRGEEKPKLQVMHEQLRKGI